MEVRRGSPESVGKDQCRESGVSSAPSISETSGASRDPTTPASASHISEESRKKIVPVHSSKIGYYRWAFLTIWLIITVIIVLDRFLSNVWPRQSFAGPPCNGKCGGDFFCGDGGEEGPTGCLRPGPWSAKVFDICARVSARLIISTTNLMFLTVSHCTWNWLSERKPFKRYLYDWRGDNLWLHTVGGWALGIWTTIHMYTLLLPSIFHGFRNVHVTGIIGWPAQVSLGTSQIDVEESVANWGSDDVWRIVWLSVIFFLIFPYSRSLRGLRKNFSFAMWLHVGAGIGFFIDSARRRTHPHVWILNLPFFFWYVGDRIASLWFYRSFRNGSARRIILDKNYMLLLWNQDKVGKGICDLYWIKEKLVDKRRASEWSHPFTTASAHYIKIGESTQGGRKNSNDSSATTSIPEVIEVPISTDTYWDGHRFTLKAHTCHACDDEKAKIVRTDTLDFQGMRKVDEGMEEQQYQWDCMAIMRIQRHVAKSSSLPRWLSTVGQRFCGLVTRGPETVNIADRDVENNQSGTVPIRFYGPYRSAYGRLSELPNLPPLIIIGSGAGAALVISVLAYIREEKVILRNPVKIYYSASSLPLLQFVSNNLLAVKVPNLDVQCALTRNEDLDFEDAKEDEKKGQLRLARFDVEEIVLNAESNDTEVFFCGAGAINDKLKKQCEKRMFPYVGSSVS